MSIASVEFGSFNKVRRERVKGVVPEVLRAPKDVMEAGPVLVEGEDGKVRSQWDLFKEYCGKAKFFLTGEFYGERAAGMIDPEVKSRHGNAKSETGEFWNPRGLFREAAVLAANISLVDQGKISTEELTRQYDGLMVSGQDGVGQLRDYLGRLFGRIKYRDLERKDAIQKREEARPKLVLIPKTDEEGEVDPHRFVVGTWADLHQQQVVVQEAEAKKTNKKVKVVAACGVVLVACSACMPAAVEIIKTATAERPPTNPGSTQTVRPTETAEPQMTATPTYHVEAAGGEYNAAQEALNNSPSALEQEARIQRWLDYWVNFENRPFAVDTDQIHWKFIYDNFNNPTEVMVVIEAGGEYGNRIFTAPIGGDGFAEFPPPVSGNTIQENYGPLELTSGAEGLTLSVENGIPVRRNANGVVMERLNMQNGQWETVGLSTEMVFNNPANYEYLINHPDEFVRAPDPLVDGVDVFMNWYENVFVPAMGDRTARVPNITATSMSTGSEHYVSCQPRCKMGGQVGFFYFESNGVFYPAYSMTISYKGENSAPYTVILVQGRGANGLGSMDIIASGDQYFAMSGIYSSPNEFFSNDVNEMISQGLISDHIFPSRARIGFGEISFLPNP